jgi:hypothetical protein
LCGKIEFVDKVDLPNGKFDFPGYIIEFHNSNLLISSFEHVIGIIMSKHLKGDIIME